MTEIETSSTNIKPSNYYYALLHSHPCKPRNEIHRTFGGRIYNSDFSDNRGKDNINGSPIASRIESDARWEEKLRTGKDGRIWNW